MTGELREKISALSPEVVNHEVLARVRFDGAQPPGLRQNQRVSARVLIEEENTGARYLRKLANEEKGIDAGLHSLLLEMMAMDSEKHARLLQFVQARLDARASA